MEYLQNKNTDTETIEELKDEIVKLNNKIEDLNNLNKQIVRIADSNYTLIQSIIKRSDTYLKTMNDRNSKSLKMIYYSIGVVVFIIVIMISSIISIHFL